MAVATAPHASASLYVGNLAADVAEIHLFELFNPVGPVASIRVCTDRNTRRSLGYGYVNYHIVADAERALETLNYTVLHGRQLRIMWSQRDPALRKSGEGNVYIKNLDKSIDDKSLHDTFSAFGNILSCKVVVDDKGNSRGFGFVHYESPEAAELATQKLNGMNLNGKKVYVGPHIPRRERESKEEEMKQSFTNVFVKNLDENVTEEELRKLFEPFGSITSMVLSRDEATNASKGHGFVNFATHEEALAACEKLNDTEVKGKKIYVARAQKKSERTKELARKFAELRLERQNKYQGVNLYVKNLDDTIDEERLRQEFSQFGTITSTKIERDANKVSKGFGFVCFSAPEEATKCVSEMNGKMVGTKPIYVALAQRREVRRPQLEAQYAQRRLQQAQLAAAGGAMPPQMFPGGAPMFYNPSMGMAGPRQQGFMYPPMMRPPRFMPQAPGRPAAFQPMPIPAPNGMMRPARQRGQPRSGVQNGPRLAGGPPAGMMPGMPMMPGQPMMPPNANGRYKFNANARNRVDAPMMNGANGMPVGQPEAGLAPGVEPLTAEMLARASPADQKTMIGDRLYQAILRTQPESTTAKITGMLLEMDNTELLNLLADSNELNSHINLALKALEEAAGGEAEH